jgi:rhomboid family GlyGly-CTERM serine protease
MATTSRTKLIPIIVVAVGVIVVQSYQPLLEFDRQLILSGELWRLVTCHFVHTNNAHMWLNLLAALVLYICLSPIGSMNEFYRAAMGLAFSLGLLLLLYPILDWYNGLSGLLHALVAYYGVRFWREKNRLFRFALVAVWAKVTIETLSVYLGDQYMVGNMRVVTESHFLGVLAGTLAGCGFVNHQQSRKTPK